MSHQPLLIRQLGTDDFSVLLHRNVSMTPIQRSIFLMVTLFWSFAVGLFYLLHGYWLVLPYSIIEMTALVVAFRLVARHDDDIESIQLCGDILTVVQTIAGHSVRREYNRYWVQVLVIHHFDDPSILLRSHGKEWPIATFLPASERLALAENLRLHLAA
ncbi:MAG: DUF2244 domain-containing protein [Pseudomonadota bacterium]|nr:DUF2244 domain-containing protein [Pseudomonadota bacterium]